MKLSPFTLLIGAALGSSAIAEPPTVPAYEVRSYDNADVIEISRATRIEAPAIEDHPVNITARARSRALASGPAWPKPGPVNVLTPAQADVPPNTLITSTRISTVARDGTIRSKPIDAEPTVVAVAKRKNVRRY